MVAKPAAESAVADAAVMAVPGADRRRARGGGRAGAQGGTSLTQAVPVRDQLLEQALDLICKRGFNGFSYRDLAERVGVKTSSIHYYFPTKEDLALAAVEEYTARAARRIAAIDRGLPPAEQARRYLEPFRHGAAAERVCVAGMLAGESLCLPPSVHRALQDYHGMNEAWIAGLLRQARAGARAVWLVSPEAMAQVLFAGLQNGLVSARLYGKPDRLEPAMDLLLRALSPEAATEAADEAEAGTVRAGATDRDAHRAALA